MRMYSWRSTFYHSVFLRFLLISSFVVLTLITECPQADGKAFSANASPEMFQLRRDIQGMKSQIRKLERRTCPTGFIRYRRSCYRFVMGNKHKRRWYDAEQFCLYRGGHLLTLDSKRNYAFLRKYIIKNFANYNKGSSSLLYTGLIYTNEEAELPFDFSGPFHMTARSADAWRWTGTGRKPGEGPLWSPKVPESNTSPNGFVSCVMLEFNAKSDDVERVLLLRAQTCNEKYNFVCEVRIP